MTNMKKEMKKNRRKNVKWMAAAVLTATLLSGQVMPSVAAGSDTEISVSAIIPENITIESPVPLSEISLPACEYGKLSWTDETLVPTRRSEAFEVVFRPSDSFDLSRIEDWDGESDKITGYITVVVSSITASEEESWEEEYDISDEDTAQDSSMESEEIPPETEESADTGEENAGGSDTEDGDTQTDPENSGENEQTDPEEAAASDPQSTDGNESAESSEGEKEDENNEEGNEDKGNAEEPDAVIQDEGEAVPAETEDETIKDGEEEGKDHPEEVQGDGQEEPKEDSAAEEEQNPEEDPGENPGEEPEDNPGENPGEEPEDNPGENQGEEPEDNPGEDPGENPETPDNIFDRPVEEPEDDRPVTAEENLTDEEMAQRAQENHSCNGIYVSGINLPWYVQFRATSGESYEFTNESHANIFRSYEFELWDLKNDTEYEIPDGEYISVTIPVKEGYEYTIEHLLDNGAMETIIPSVEGSTMIFSTHSFSPFGIAGSKPLVGGEVSENTYLTPTPTLAPTKTPSGNNGNSNNSGNNNNTTGNTNSGGQSNAGGGSEEPTKDKSGYSTKVTPTSSSDYNSSGSGQSGNGTSQSADQTKQSAQNTSSVNAVKTGDNTRILPFVILVAAAAVIIAVVLFLKKKKK